MIKFHQRHSIVGLLSILTQVATYKILDTQTPFLIKNSSLLVKYCSANFMKINLLIRSF